MAELKRLFEPGRIGKVETKNRIVMAPLLALYCTEDGFVTDRLINYYVARAKGEVGLIICHASIAHRDSWAGKYWMAVYDDRFIPGLARMARAIHDAGAKAVLQIAHGGFEFLESRRAILGPSIEPLGPSAVPYLKPGYTPKEMTKAQIQFYVEGFAQGARRVRDAGFDGVEFHGAHGYFFNEFLSPRTNRRTDEYGGSVENRTRVAREVIQRTRALVGPDFAIIFRMNGSDYLEGGITVEDACLQAPLIASAGADALHISASARESTHWQFLTYMHPHGAITMDAAAVKKAVNIPIITVGKISDPVLAEQYLEEGRADFVALGRQLLADPEWASKARQGRLDDIRRCIYCNIGCTNRNRERWEGMTCTVNPAVGREEFFAFRPTKTPRNVMVIGGGIAGMEAARILAERGHKVTLYEKTGQLGGQWRIAQYQDYKKDSDFPRLTEQVIQGLKRAPVKMHMKTTVTKELVAKERPDVVIVATGARPHVPKEMPGVGNRNVLLYEDVLMGKAQVGKTVAVLGAGYTGMETALHLAERGHKTYLLTRSRVGRNAGMLIKRTLREKLREAGVYVIPYAPVAEIMERGVRYVEDAEVRPEFVSFRAPPQEYSFLPCDSVVLALGEEAQNSLVAELQGVAPEVYAIGDCVRPRDLMDAMHEAWQIGHHLD